MLRTSGALTLALLARLPRPVRRAAPRQRQPPVVEVGSVVSKEELDSVQRQIDRMKDIIGANEAARELLPTRRLILLRHAKTLWERNMDIPDHDRVLSTKGKEEARLVGSELVSRAWLPDAVLCSDAVRTVQTLRLLNVPEKDGQADTMCMESLYYAVTGEEMAVAVDNALGEKGFVDCSTLMVVCHNPGCEELVEQLTGHRPEMKTGCAALLQYPEKGERREEGGRDEPFRLVQQQSQWDLVEVLRPSVLAAVRSLSEEE